jgi:YbbR domain-containing protein
MKILRELFLKNLTLKAISATLALLLWMQIAGQQRVERSIAIPLEFTNMPRDIEITNDYPRNINVRFSRPSSLNMDEQQLAVVMDLAGVEASTVILPVSERNIRNLPTGVRIEGIEQRRIRLQLETIRQKIVRVEPEIVGTPAEGYEFKEAQMNPSEVLISGPESRVNPVTTAMTETINIEGRTSGFHQTAYLDLEDSRVRIETGSTVEVVVFIEEERRKISTRIPVRILPETVKARSSYRTIRVVLSVPVSYKEEVDLSGFFAALNVEQVLSNGEVSEISPVIIIPEEYRDIVEVESSEPERVKVTF